MEIQKEDLGVIRSALTEYAYSLRVRNNKHAPYDALIARVDALHDAVFKEIYGKDFQRRA